MTISHPLMLRRANAARLCDMTVAQFERAMSEGTMPQPVLIAGEERWALSAIEDAIRRLTNGDQHDWRSKQPGLRNAA